MKEHKDPHLLLLIVTALLCICAIAFLGNSTLQKIRSSKARIEELKESAAQESEKLDKTLNHIKEQQLSLQAIKEKQQLSRDEKAMLSESPEPSAVPENLESPAPSAPPEPSPTPTQKPAHKVAIDPGHQGEWVDMSALEPNGPGSSEMKARCSTGTAGVYTGLAEYQLNLDVSLKLRDLLEERGYEVFLTRTDNDANISNAERAQQASSSGAEIYVRIHANGEESHTVSGALALCPTLNNPYVASLAEESHRLSQAVLDSYCAKTGFANLGIQGSDTMTGINWSSIPVMILEMGFMTFESDDTQMADSSFQDVMAQGIADGIDSYFS
ncbi:MAG: N-acetylmuramoyl-L-alanine amidase [Eubacteriales bacterium]|nr:N-acetylmuramoyl-L-alanine amidase [Eubacteriales bacterium]